jgi:hypothetical protein
MHPTHIKFTSLIITNAFVIVNAIKKTPLTMASGAILF